MNLAGIPSKIPLAWAASAGSSYRQAIPLASQIGIAPGRASWTDGYPPLTFQNPAAGGVFPFGSDMNGVLYSMSSLLLWYQAGGGFMYDGGYSTNIGGYPAGAVLASSTTPGEFWRSTADNNTTDPDGSSPANWVPAFGNGSLTAGPPGTVKGTALGATVVSDLDGTHIDALLTPFVGDSGSGGVQGVVPAPGAGTSANGYYLNANGSFTQIDLTKGLNAFELFTISRGSSGYIKFPQNGLILQWTIVNIGDVPSSGAGSTGTGSWPVTFPNAVFGQPVFGQYDALTGGPSCIITAQATSTSGFSWAARETFGSQTQNLYLTLWSLGW